MEPTPTPLRAANLNHLWAQLLVEECVRHGVNTFFVAPGSRSTPLTTAVARHPDTHVIVHVDERGTAFAALGYGRATGRPAGWITTSGTAVANGLPAVVEAATDGVPMLLLTADRPPELRDTAANQTIDQVKIFGDYARWQFDLPTPTTDIAPQMVLTTAAQAIHRARRMPPGPVHLNCMFRKPLAPVPDGHDYADYTAPLADWAARSEPYTAHGVTRKTPGAEAVDTLVASLREAACGLIVAGRLRSEAERAAVLQLAETMGWPLLPDITSNLRLGPVADAVARIPFADQLLTSEAFRAAHRPDCVLHLGGRFVSKRLQQFVEAVRPRQHIVVRPDPARFDPGHQVTRQVESDVAAFCTALAEAWDGSAGRPAGKSDWTAAWQAVGARAQAAIEAFDQQAEALTEPLAARLIAEYIPDRQALVLASSMPVRDMNRYGTTEGAAVPVFANRGASGIDGTIATAAGVIHGRRAAGDRRQQPGATLLIGDLALQHDLNSLALLRSAPMVVVVINNNGGGIFHFLPIAESGDVFEPYFATPQYRAFHHAAALYELSYYQPKTPSDFVSAYLGACADEGGAIIEVKTERAANHALHETLERRVADAVEAGG